MSTTFNIETKLDTQHPAPSRFAADYDLYVSRAKAERRLAIESYGRALAKAVRGFFKRRPVFDPVAGEAECRSAIHQLSYGSGAR